MKKETKLIIILFLLLSCENKKDYTSIRKQLIEVYKQDQAYRENPYKQSEQMIFDNKNRNIVSKIIDSLGWLGPSEIGDTASMALFLTIQHSNIETMEKYLPIMKQAVENKKAQKQCLALLTDRVEVFNNRPQIYGSQLDGNYVLFPIIDSQNVNKRRKEMGLEPIEDYLKRFK